MSQVVTALFDFSSDKMTDEQREMSVWFGARNEVVQQQRDIGSKIYTHLTEVRQTAGRRDKAPAQGYGL